MKPSPFWLLAGGLGAAFLITSGRARAIYDVLTQPIPKEGPTVPSCAETYGPGYEWDPIEGKCIKTIQQ